jgi:UDP-glucose 4-epimerase
MARNRQQKRDQEAESLKVLVTGGAGFIGSNLVDALIDRGDEVIALDNLTTGRKSNLEPAISRGAQLVVEDIRDAGLAASLLEKERPEVVFHLAAQIDVRVSTARPAFDAEINVMGTINMLEAARSAGTRRFVYASTGGAIYGETDVVPTPEDTVINPEAPYGQAKYAGEGYLGLWKRMHDLSTVSLRFGNVYGPRQDPLGEAGVIAIFCGKLESGGQPTVFGDGRQTRDYIYAEDVVRACMLAADSDVGGAFNVGRGEEVSVLQLVDALRELGAELGHLNGNSFEAQFAPPRLGEVMRSALDPTRARKELGFTAEVDLENGLRRTLLSVAGAKV